MWGRRNPRLKVQAASGRTGTYGNSRNSDLAFLADDADDADAKYELVDDPDGRLCMRARMAVARLFLDAGIRLGLEVTFTLSSSRIRYVRAAGAATASCTATGSVPRPISETLAVPSLTALGEGV